jgi:hypothetical protein
MNVPTRKMITRMTMLMKMPMVLPGEEDEPACDRAKINAHEESDDPEDNADDNAVDHAFLEQRHPILFTWLHVPVDQPDNKGQQFQPHFFFPPPIIATIAGAI